MKQHRGSLEKDHVNDEGQKADFFGNLLQVATETDFFGPGRKSRLNGPVAKLVYVDRYFWSYVECTGRAALFRESARLPPVSYHSP